MKESTKEKLKTVGMLAGAIGGSCASSYLCACLTAVCPPVGIPAIIGKFVISSIVAEKSAEHCIDMCGKLIDGAEAVSSLYEDYKQAESEVEETSEEEA